MTPTILDEIVASKRREVAAARLRMPLEEMEDQAGLAPPVRDFRAALAGPGPIQLIAEVKKASPSAQVIRADFDPIAIARIYQAHGAACLSVLTDAPYFQGHLSYLARIRASVAIPLLRKDFIIDEYQVVEARLAGADAILLIAEILDDATLRGLLERARGSAWRPLSSSTTRPTCPGSWPPAPSWSGSTTATCTGSSPTWSRRSGSATGFRPSVTLVSESGIRTRRDVERLEAAGVSAILVGEALMRADDIGLAVERLLGLEPETQETTASAQAAPGILNRRCGSHSDHGRLVRRRRNGPVVAPVRLVDVRPCVPFGGRFDRRAPSPPSGAALRLADQHQVPRVDDQPHALADDDHRVLPVARVREERQAAQKAEPPERHRDHRVALPFRGDPLHQEPRGEQRLARKADDQPEPCLRHRHRSNLLADTTASLGRHRRQRWGRRRIGQAGCLDGRGHLVTRRPAHQPGDAEEVDDHPERAIPEVVVRPAVRPGPVVHRQLDDPAPLAEQATGRRSDDSPGTSAAAAPSRARRSGPSSRCRGSTGRAPGCGPGWPSG